MDIKPIKTDEDYQAALIEIERLFQAAPDTPEGDRLDVLALHQEVGFVDDQRPFGIVCEVFADLLRCLVER